jgi:GR25 family glycosyltransferase involved in LPS biosynthesis
MSLKNSTLGFDKIYVINLKRRKDRRDILIKENPEIDFTFIEAVDGKEITTVELQKQGLVGSSFFDPTGMLTTGIFACALSHKKAWDQALKDGVENALFLEDDIFFVTPFIENSKLTPIYKEILKEQNDIDWDIVQYGKKTEQSHGIILSKNFVIPRYRTNFNGAHCYGVTKQMIKTLSDNCIPVKYAADVYIETFYNTHNIINLSNSLVRQKSDIADAANADSDTYYNDYRESGGKIGISFDSEGNVINKSIAQYIKHPKDIIDQHVEIVLEKYNFGRQKFNRDSFFGLSDLLKHIGNFTDENSKMIEINSHTGESTFFFGCSGLFKNIYTVDSYVGEDEFNIKNNLSWEDIKIAYSNNTSSFNNVNHLTNLPEEIIDSFSDIFFTYINNRKRQDVKKLIESILPAMNKEGFIGGYGPTNIVPTKTFCDGSWLIKVGDIVV